MKILMVSTLSRNTRVLGEEDVDEAALIGSIFVSRRTIDVSKHVASMCLKFFSPLKVDCEEKYFSYFSYL